jgi:hypothetical protein
MVLVAQEASFTTGGGVARLDQFNSGPIGTLAADAAVQVGPLAFRLAGATVNHQNLGNANRVRSDINLTAASQGWHVAVGPVLEYGSSVREPWSRAWSGSVTVRREIGPAELQVSAGEGLTNPNEQRVSFGRRGAMAGIDFGPLTLHGRFDMVIVRDSVLRDDVFFDPTQPIPSGSSPFRDRVRQVEDAAVVLGVELPLFDMRATLGRRSGDDIVSQTWYRLEAVLPVAEAASVVFTTVRHPADAVLGLRGSRELTLGLRVALPDEARRNAEPLRVEVVRESDLLVRVVFVLPGGARARVMGEMTGWQPVELEPTGRGKFVGWFLSGAGTFRVNVSLDGGPWIAPPGMPRVEDGFGGLVGLLEL